MRHCGAPRVALAAVAACFALGAMLLGAPPAAADDPVFDRAFGAGPVDVCASVCRAGSNGSGAAQLSFPAAVAVAGAEVFVADQNNHRIGVYATDGTFLRAFGRNVNLGGVNPDVCSIASTCRAGAPGGTAGQLNSPYAVAVSAGEVFVADASNNRVSVFTTGGAFVRAFGKDVNAGPGDPDVCTGATTCRAGSQGGGPGQLSFPLGVAVSGGEVYVADTSNNRVSVYGVAGGFSRSFGTTGNGAGQLSFPFGIAVSGGEVFVADQNNHRVTVFGSGGTFARAFGKGVNAGVGNPDVCTTDTTCRGGTFGAAAGQLRSPIGVAAAGGEIYVTDGNHRVSAFAADGTFARAFAKGVNPGTGDPDVCTAATTCQSAPTGGSSGQLNNPAGLAVAGGEVYVADTSNYRVGVFSTAGAFARAWGKSVWAASPFVCTTVTGCGPGSAGGGAAQLNLPLGVAVAGGEAFVADQANNRISVYATTGTFARAFGKDVNAGAGTPGVCTAATTCRAGSSGSAAGQLSMPAAVAIGGGEAFVADQNNHRISVYATDGTFARAFGKNVNPGPGNPDVCTAATGCQSASLGGAAGQLDNPMGVAVSGGLVYVTEQGNRRISVFAPDGTFVRAFGKDVNAGSTGDPDVCTPATTCRFGSQGAAAGQLNGPAGLAISGGEVYVADQFNARVSVYGTGGAFSRAFGKAVNGSGAGNPDVCTTATTCRAGSQGGAAGQVSFPSGVAVGDGAVYVSERFNARVSVFGTDGAFARAFGKGVNAGAGNPDVCTQATTCRAAAPGDAAGQFFEPLGVAMTGTQIFVADRLNHRVGVFRVPRTEIAAAPITLGFAPRDVDDGPTATQTSTITNTGTEAVTLSGLTLTGDAAHFSRLTGGAGDCSTTTVLAAGATCSVRLRFDPTTTGPKSATLTITSNAPAISVAATGTGTQTQLSRVPVSLAFGARDIDDGPAADQSSTIANVGTETVTLTGLTLSGDSAHFARLTGAAGDCTASTQLDAGETCSVRMRFDPTSAGAKTATLTVASTGAPALTVALSGAGMQTELSRAPAALAFGNRDVDGGPAPVQSTTVTNTGSETIGLTGVTLSGDTAHFARLTGAAGDCTATTVLAAGEACALRVRFDPATTGAKAATLAVTSNAAPISVALTGTGVRIRLSPAPAALAFGARDVAQGPAADQASTITNTGTETVTLTGVALTGDATAFTRLTGETGDCAPTTELDPGATCSVRVRFDPASIGAKTATITLTSNAPALAIPLAGSGTHTELARTPAALAFGIRDVDTGATAIQTATLTNTGTEPIAFTGFALSGDGAHFVRVTGAADDCSAASGLGPGQTCNVRLRFDPSSIGAKAATMTATSNAAPVAVALTGNGIQTQVSSDPPSLTFGTRDIDEGAAGHSATIANTGTQRVTLTGLTLSGDSAHFSRLTGAAGDCAAATELDAGETCTLRVGFDPVTVGVKSAAVTIASNAPALVVGLTGSGTTTQADRDGDGTPDADDTDDDNDGVPDAGDAFPLDPSEWVDTDRDGVGNNADTDDDNDGVEDKRDAFPLDPTRQSAPPAPPAPAPVAPAPVEPAPVAPAPVEPAPVAPAPVEPAARTVFAPWRLERTGRVRVVVRGEVVRVASGYVAVCPAGGPECVGRMNLRLLRRSPRTRKIVPIFLTGKSKPVTVAAGTRRKLTFRLSAGGRARLERLRSLTAVLRGSMRVEGQPPVTRRARLRLSAPRA